ncbi:DUF982 domain-containing protein [Mesorhizobium australicum]|uniref:DUF982 domain-containing protein n=1 Tax=Mesorhizobium australicum TaxID=536018 RepID=UPI0033381127
MGLLATHWRDAESRKHRSALRACRRATSGDLPPETAREAYLEATREAHIAARQGTGDSVRPDRERRTASGPADRPRCRNPAKRYRPRRPAPR